MTKKFTSFEEAAAYLTSLFPEKLKMAAPLGLGKPNQLINEIYRYYKGRPSTRLEIFTALSLSRPQAKPGLEERFLKPFADRHFGADYPDLEYVSDLKAGKLPKNIEISEFYFQAGAYKGNERAQAKYTSVNYTHVAHSLILEGVQCAVQLVAKHPTKNTYSLSCNPDLTVDVKTMTEKTGRTFPIIAVVHPDLPYLGGQAEVDENFFAGIVESKDLKQELFALPKEPVDMESHLIGFHASQLIADDGTLQIGIGSLSDGIVASLLMRQSANDVYRQISSEFTGAPREILHLAPFEKGIYGTSEMLLDGFMHLRRGNILKRTVKDRADGHPIFLHGAFFLGSKEFYSWLRNLDEKERSGIGMESVSKINDLYDEDEYALRRQRKNARFFNICMNATVFGEAVSDTLENGEVISGIGGQYNFVAMSHEMPDARSVLMLKSSRHSHEGKISNIRWSAGRVSIPRHLRDVFVTEYGIADVRYRSDEEVIRAMIEISDVEFQDELISIAQKNCKLSPHYRVPPHALKNSKENLKRIFEIGKEKGFFKDFPFGSDFNETELRLLKALKKLKSASPFQIGSFAIKGAQISKQKFAIELDRMDLVQALSTRDWVLQKALLGALSSH